MLLSSSSLVYVQQKMKVPRKIETVTKNKIRNKWKPKIK